MSKKSKKNKEPKVRFSDRIYMTKENIGTEDEFYNVFEAEDDLPNDEQLVGIYMLTKVVQLEVRRQLLDAPLKDD